MWALRVPGAACHVPHCAACIWGFPPPNHSLGLFGAMGRDTWVPSCHTGQAPASQVPPPSWGRQWSPTLLPHLSPALGLPTLFGSIKMVFCRTGLVLVPYNAVCVTPPPAQCHHPQGYPMGGQGGDRDTPAAPRVPMPDTAPCAQHIITLGLHNPNLQDLSPAPAAAPRHSSPQQEPAGPGVPTRASPGQGPRCLLPTPGAPHCRAQQQRGLKCRHAGTRAGRLQAAEITNTCLF